MTQLIATLTALACTLAPGALAQQRRGQYALQVQRTPQLALSLAQVGGTDQLVAVSHAPADRDLMSLFDISAGTVGGCHVSFASCYGSGVKSAQRATPSAAPWVPSPLATDRNSHSRCSAVTSVPYPPCHGTPVLQGRTFRSVENRFCSSPAVCEDGSVLYFGGDFPNGAMRDGRSNIGVS